MRRYRLMACHLIFALVFLAGCDGGNKDVSNGTKEAPPGKPRPATPNETATAELRNAKSASTAAANFYGFVRDGALPAALDLYAPRSIRGVDLGLFSGALANQKVQLEGTRLNVIDSMSTAGGRLVTLEILPKLGAKSRHTLFFRRVEGQWKLTYDTLSAGALQGFAQIQAQRRAGEKEPSPKSLAAGDDAVATYRRVALR